ncbi:MAG: hypothetical protein H7Z41_01010, partial [Cytophagales bacterium]|nr:hypothetical protein [Armatimonadota bacterium]
MTIEYENTVQDAAAWYVCWLNRTRSGHREWRRLRLVRCLGTVALVCLAASQWNGLSGLHLTYVGLVAAILLAGVPGYFLGNIGQKGIVRRWTQNALQSGMLAPFLGSKGLTVTPQGFRT